MPQNAAQIVLRNLPQRPVDVQVNRGPIVLAAQFLDAPLEPTRIARQFRAILAQLLRDVVHQGVGQRRHPADDHLVGVVVTLAARLGVDGHHRVRQRQAPLVGNDLGHGHAARQGHRFQQSLAHAVADRGVQPALYGDPLCFFLS